MRKPTTRATLSCFLAQSSALDMDCLFPWSNGENLLLTPNKEANYEILAPIQQEDPLPLFLHFPSPFLDDFSSTPLLPNHQQDHLNTENMSLNIMNSTSTEPSPAPSKIKRPRKRRSAGKTDRHSKIRTAQGLRDRRMRLSLHTARKFFDLQDMLGFDKASKTIEWLFSKSKKAIKEVSESLKSQKHSTNQSEEQVNKGEKMKGETMSNPLVRESRDKARARARERTRERMTIKYLNDESKKFLGSNPNNDFDQPGLGFSTNPNCHKMEESSVSSLLEYPSSPSHFPQLQLPNDVEKLGNYLGSNYGSSSTYCSIFDCQKINSTDFPSGWLNSSNSFLGFLGGFDAENFVMESYNHEGVPVTAPLIGNVHGQNPSSILISTANLVHLQSQDQGN